MRELPAITIIFVLILSTSLSLFAQTEVEGEVNGVWSIEGSPYVAVNTLQVPDGDTLLIEAGVEVHFNDNLPMIVYGLLNALGTEQDSIFFRPLPGGESWGGLRLLDADSTTRFDYCSISNGLALGGEGQFDSVSSGGNVFIWQGQVLFENSRISQGQASGVGGGIAIWQSSPVFRNCLINENVSRFRGGGAGVIQSSSPEFIDCQFVENVNTSAGGGMYIAFSSNPRIVNCSFLQNNTNGRNGSGAGIFIGNQSSPEIGHCLFVNNHSSGEGADGGAIAIRDVSEAYIHDSEFEENESSDSGGALYIRGNDTNPLIERCIFLRNTITAGDRTGGAVYIREGAGVELRHSQFIRNVADFGGALSVKEPPNCNIHHNLFVGNGSRLGGAALSVDDDLGGNPLAITNCTFINQSFTGINPTSLTANTAGNSRIHFSSCIMWDNQPRFNNDELISVEYSQIKDGFDGEENSDENPLFFEKDSTWFVLRGDSPCIDTGNPGLPADPDESQSDRGWMYYPHNAFQGIETDTLFSELTTIDRDTLVLRFENITDVPLYLTPMDLYCEGIRDVLIDVTGIIGDREINGVTFSEEGFYLSGGNNGQSPKNIYYLDRNFNLRGHFEQPGVQDDTGFLDLATDGNSVLWGGDDHAVTEFTIDGEFGASFDLQYESNPHIDYVRAISADFSNPFGLPEFYLSGDEGFILHTDSDLWEIDRIQVEDVVYGLGVKANSGALYIVTEPAEGKQLLSLVLPTEHRIIPLYNLTPPENYRMGGIEVTQNWTEGHGTLIGIFKGDGGDGDKLFIEDLYTSWLVIVPELRLVMPGESAEWRIVFAGDQMSAGRHESQFCLTLNGVSDGGEIVTMMDLEQSGISKPESAVPSAIDLEGVYPNPFNSNARFSYTMQQAGDIKAVLHDQQGRVVVNILDEFRAAGRHTGWINGSALPSGEYYLHLKQGAVTVTSPLTIIK